MKGLIYKIENKTDHKIYIGQTTRSFEGRISQHKAASSQPGAHPRKLYDAVNKSSWDNFTFQVIQEIDEPTPNKLQDSLNLLEEQYIQQYNSINNGYNTARGGSPQRDFGNVYLKYDMEDNLVDVYRTIEQTGHRDSRFYKTRVSCANNKMEHYNWEKQNQIDVDDLYNQTLDWNKFCSELLDD